MQKAAIVVASLVICTALQSEALAKQVMVTGCVWRGVEACLMITDSKTKKIYQINSANPAPSPAQGLAVMLSGKASNMGGFCMQGTPLTDIKWTYTKMRCVMSGGGMQK